LVAKGIDASNIVVQTPTVVLNAVRRLCLSSWHTEAIFGRLVWEIYRVYWYDGSWNRYNLDWV